MTIKEKGINMSMYHSKLLELLAIENIANKSYLHARLSFNGTIDFLLEIDNKTAAHLLAAVSFDEKNKYRLSLYSFKDSAQKNYVSYVTRTYLDQSERIYFSCSEKYANSLDSIKNIQYTHEIRTLPFLSNFIEINDELKNKREQASEYKEAESRKLSLHISWSKFGLLSLAIIILFGFKLSDLSMLNKIETSEKVTANAEIVTKQSVESIENEEIHSQIGVSSPMQPSLPFIELNETTTYSIPKNAVAITFDDGPSQYSKKIVDILKEYQVGGTFFYIGINVKKNRDAVQYVKENGFTIGNHSLSHKQLTILDNEMQKYEIMEAKQLIEEITLEEVKLFRPPYGAMDETTVDLAITNNNKVVLWNNDPKDWESQNPDLIFNHIRNSENAGSIILLHESQAVIDALPRIIEYLQAQNLQIVSLK